MILDSYEKEFTAKVENCLLSGEFFKIELSRTVFFPEGGGQFADKGKLILNEKSVEVFDVQEEDGHIYHFTKEELPKDVEVKGVIDWDTRFVRMQNHTGEHIVSGFVHSEYGFDNIGFHLGDDDVTCDYNGTLTWDEIKHIEKLCNKAVFENHKVTVSFPTPEELPSLDYRAKLDLTEGVRLVTIEGVDVCACCAPHVAGTAEVGLIKIVNFEKSHGGTRLHLRCGAMALADYDEKQTQALKIGDLLSARQYELSDCVEQLQKANAGLSYQLSKMSEKLALTKLEATERQDGNLVMVLDGADTDALLALANGGREKVTGLFVALTPNADGFRYMITSGNPETKLSQIAKEINANLNGRGGGKDELIQGAFKATLEEIEKYFA